MRLAKNQIEERPLIYIILLKGRAVQTARSLEEGLKSVNPLGSAEVVFDENNGKLVHLSGPLHTDKVRQKVLHAWFLCIQDFLDFTPRTRKRPLFSTSLKNP